MTHCIILAAGFGRRFQGDKLNTLIQGKEMYRHVLDHLLQLEDERLCDVRIVSRAGALHHCPIPILVNENADEGISSSIRIGLTSLPVDDFPSAFFTADQPFLHLDTLRGFLTAEQEKGILCCAFHGRPGSPVLFSRNYSQELLQLHGDIGGKTVMHRHLDDITFFEVSDTSELDDIDTLSNLGGNP